MQSSPRRIGTNRRRSFRSTRALRQFVAAARILGRAPFLPFLPASTSTTARLAPLTPSLRRGPLPPVPRGTGAPPTTPPGIVAEYLPAYRIHFRAILDVHAVVVDVSSDAHAKHPQGRGVDRIVRDLGVELVQLPQHGRRVLLGGLLPPPPGLRGRRGGRRRRGDGGGREPGRRGQHEPGCGGGRVPGRGTECEARGGCGGGCRSAG